ncbi:MAG: acetate--CoA ligase family protein [Spirochaetes bacterium]|nr:acetate--CoA ligase family protein [Spirochaetota bacterium]
MDKIFYPESLVIIGLSPKPNNIPRMILENLLRWGYRGRIFGTNPRTEVSHVDGIRMYKNIADLPEVPDLAVCLVPAKFVPDYVEECGKIGIRRMAIPSGGFSEFGEEGKKLSEKLIENAKKYNIRFVGPNGLMVANTANGLCLPFVPLYRPPKGKMSIITQSGGVGLMMWNLMMDEHIGMAKFASIGNKLDLDEVDFLKYLGDDPETDIICMYLESIMRGRELVELAKKINKPIVIYKSNITDAGKRAAMSHTAAISNDEDIIDSAFEEAGIIRIRNYNDFIAVVKAFQLPPMKGNRIMVMSPAGGFSVIGADLCEQAGFDFADPGDDFYESLQSFANAGVIKFSNPLDMGDIYDPQMVAHVVVSVMHNENVDGAIIISQRPKMPEGDNVFYGMFLSDLSKETYGAILSSGKPLGICLYGLSSYMHVVKQNVNFPIFNNPEEMVRALAFQRDYYARKEQLKHIDTKQTIVDARAKEWINSHTGVIGEESLEVLSLYGIPVVLSGIAHSEDEAVKIAKEKGFPVVMKVVSPDAVHKTDAGGVLLNINSEDEVRKGFCLIRENLFAYKKNATFIGVRIQNMVNDGYDMFIGGKFDQSFGPVIFFGFGGIFVEIFKDIACLLCPAEENEVRKRIAKLNSYKMLKGARGKTRADIDAFVSAVVQTSKLLAAFPQIRELDINPFRIFNDGKGAVALDARMRIEL